MIIGALYHWSPAARRKQIIRYGLRPGCRPTIGTVSAVSDGRQMVCLAFTPSTAWNLSGNMPWAHEVSCWDLWQVTLAETDEVHPSAAWGPRMGEVRVANRIPKSRVWWIAQRTR